MQCGLDCFGRVMGLLGVAVEVIREGEDCLGGGLGGVVVLYWRGVYAVLGREGWGGAGCGVYAVYGSHLVETVELKERKILRSI